MKIVMLGSGYVGLVTGACFSEFGYEVICVDKDNKKINNLKNKLYEQVNILGDTLLDNDNVEKIFDERDPNNNKANSENQKIIKMVN